MANELIFLRHGATAGNLKRQYIGRTDEPLCPEGIAQAKALALPDFRPDVLLVSPALRARQTAELAFPGQRAEIVPDLREMDFGRFEGRSPDELADDPDYRRWVDGMCLGAVPEGEHTGAFKARCCGAFLQAAEKLPDGNRAAIVLHGGCIMAILEAYALPRRGFYDYHVGNCGWVRCLWADGSLRITGGTLN